MKLKDLTAAASAALLLVSTAGVAHANSAQSLSLENLRASSSVGKENSAVGNLGPGAYVVGAVLLGLIIWGIIEISDDNDDPDSA